MYLIVGLGNPGEEYEKTRHNVGRMIVSVFEKKFECSAWKEDKKARAKRAGCSVHGENVELLLPETFMNRSGRVVSPFVGSARKAEKLIVVHDDLDLPLGTLRISFGRGSGGHRGLESVIRALKTKDFVRLRVGVSPKGRGGVARKPIGEKKVVSFILGEFGGKEESEIKKLSRRAIEMLATIVTEGRHVAMNRYN